MGICEGVGAMVLGGFILYASWKDHTYNKKYDECSQKVQRIRITKTIKKSGKKLN